MPQRFYGVQSVSQSLKLLAKFVFNMFAPFTSPIEVKQIIHSPGSLVLVLILVITICAASVFMVPARKLFLTVGWIVVSATPTAVLGFYTDRYLVLPFVGLAMLVGFILEAVLRRAGNKLSLQLLVGFLLLCYAVTSTYRLAVYQGLWREAANEIETIMNETQRLHPQVPPGSVFYFVNLTHSLAGGQIYVFNTSLKGMLMA